MVPFRYGGLSIALILWLQSWSRGRYLIVVRCVGQRSGSKGANFVQNADSCATKHGNTVGAEVRAGLHRKALRDRRALLYYSLVNATIESFFSRRLAWTMWS